MYYEKNYLNLPVITLVSRKLFKQKLLTNVTKVVF